MLDLTAAVWESGSLGWQVEVHGDESFHLVVARRVMVPVHHERRVVAPVLEGVGGGVKESHTPTLYLWFGDVLDGGGGGVALETKLAHKPRTWEIGHVQAEIIIVIPFTRGREKEGVVVKRLPAVPVDVTIVWVGDITPPLYEHLP